MEPEHPLTLATMNNLAIVLLNEGHYEEAEKLYRATLDVQRRVLGPESSDAADTAYNLACLMAVESRRDEALSLLSEAVDHGLSPVTDLGVEKDSDLNSLHGDPRFVLLIAHAKERAAVVAGHQSN
jgi:hypothetical protein